MEEKIANFTEFCKWDDNQGIKNQRQYDQMQSQIQQEKQEIRLRELEQKEQQRQIDESARSMQNFYPPLPQLPPLLGHQGR